MQNQYLKDVSTLKLDQEKCTGCGRCAEVCPHRVLKMKNDKALIADLDKCIECGACVQNCAFNAIEVKIGVGCAYAVIKGWLSGGSPSYDCSSGESSEIC